MCHMLQWEAMGLLPVIPVLASRTAGGLQYTPMEEYCTAAVWNYRDMPTLSIQANSPQENQRTKKGERWRQLTFRKSNENSKNGE